jgi:hypothetical protein
MWKGCAHAYKSESLYGCQSVSQSVCLGVEPTLWTSDQILLPFQEFGSGICCPVSVGRPLWREVESVLRKSQSSHLSVCTFTIYIFVFYNFTTYTHIQCVQSWVRHPCKMPWVTPPLSGNGTAVVASVLRWCDSRHLYVYNHKRATTAKCLLRHTLEALSRTCNEQNNIFLLHCSS